MRYRSSSYSHPLWVTLDVLVEEKMSIFPNNGRMLVKNFTSCNHNTLGEMKNYWNIGPWDGEIWMGWRKIH